MSQQLHHNIHELMKRASETSGPLRLKLIDLVAEEAVDQNLPVIFVMMTVLDGMMHTFKGIDPVAGNTVTTLLAKKIFSKRPNETTSEDARAFLEALIDLLFKEMTATEGEASKMKRRH